ncbi:efflux RND transporter periplasmic adaptor subunit [Oceanobacillus halophilus]|uniref:Efflux RND transporter periplasmic adaptor subunit n=1 Tax=Oceanobacillus halophilus TaxID=930130 RepID=A0A494ZZP4_9BACI|nr:efflux RND transporter periplasmic adaptor subunit [Oceanobacillus halophilus]RKQ32280.1 efflux RND transporter periplasmic adaptor subunit [Oceanobacillus halophilus]
MKRRILLIGVILFIGLNLMLIYIDDNGKVNRVSYINEWVSSFEADMVEQMDAIGVLSAQTEEHVYFDKSLGSFEEFLVNEGDDVAIGDPLYAYRVHDYYETETKLISEMEKVKEEISSIELAINDMQMYQIPTIPADPTSNFNITEDHFELQVELPDSTKEAEVLRQQYLVDLEKELAQKNAEVLYIESQLETLRANSDMITVGSPYEGKIQDLSVSLEDPVLTIQSEELNVTGELTEDQHKKVKTGFKANVTLNEEEMHGTVSDISHSPKAIDVNKESIYSFQVSLNDEVDQTNIYPGYHTDVSIILEESIGTTVLKDSAVFMDSIWKMSEDGKLTKQIVETGLSMDNLIEITNGIEMGEMVAQNPDKQFRNGAKFITPLKIKQLTWDSLGLDKSNWKKYLVTGLISR